MQKSIPNWVLVRGSGDIGSAVAHGLFQAGYAVLMHELPQPTVIRRKMSFADAVFDGSAVLEGVNSERVDDLSLLSELLLSHKSIPLVTVEIFKALEISRPQVLVDARMRKHSQPEKQIQLAGRTI